MIEAVVIGGGQAGLAASWHLTRRGIEHVVLERGRVGETWRSERWDSFALNTPNWMNRLAGENEDVEPRDAFLTRDAWISSLQGYADQHHVPIRTATEVTAVEPGGAPGTFRITTQGAAGIDALETRHVVVAAGGQRAAKRPPIASQLPPWIHQLHTVDYRSPGVLPAGAVLVVGSAQSGIQIAEDLLDAGRTTYLATSAVGRLRRRMYGRDALDWLVRIGFYDVTPEQLPDQRMMTVPIPQISGVGRYGHSVSLQWLAERGARLVGRPVGIEGDRLLLDHSVGSNILAGDRASAMFKGMIEQSIEASGATLPPLEPDPADDPLPDPMSVVGPEALDLERLGISTVIWATGFTADFGFLRLPVLDAAGIPVHERGQAAVPGIHFLGLRWLTKRKSALITAADEEAEQLADRVVAASMSRS